MLFGKVLKSRIFPLVLAASIGAAVLVTGAGAGMDRALQMLRDSVRAHPASDRFVLVEIDARSLRALEGWPWPRSVHAEAIRRLNLAGAKLIAFDVDFSAPSVGVEDQKFAAAIAASTAPVILPTFRQYASQHSEEEVESLPIPMLRDHAQLAAVNIIPDNDGLVRKYPSAVVTGGVPRPSMGSMLANASGTAGEQFPIDTSIDPASLKHISYIDVLNGRISKADVAGKYILVGASAIELGDRYPIPGWGVVSGPAIQLLAAETLRSGSSPMPRSSWIALGLAIFLLYAGSRTRARQQAGLVAAGGIALLALPLGLESLQLGSMAVVPALAALAGGMTWIGAARAIQTFSDIRGIDQLSGLPNRRTLERDLARANSVTAIVALRLWGYVDFATLLGPSRGAELVSRVADRLRASGIDAIYRIEEISLAFVISSAERRATEELFAMLVSSLAAPVEVAARQIKVDAVFGRAGLDGDKVGASIDHALLAADQAREQGRAWEDHSTEMEGSRDWRISLAGELDSAMAAGEIWVAFQPKWDLRLNRVSAAEALVRWDHPVRGRIPPDSFIPILEKNGQILDLTLYVLDRAMEQAASWSAVSMPINIAVNVSAPLLTNSEFMSAITGRLANGTILADLLTFEITESASMENSECALDAMHRLADLGVRLSIDDYGTGQSTLNYLKHLPAKEIKIDKSFVLAITDNRSDEAMVRSTIDLAHELGFVVVAEGVENQAVLDLLQKMGCDYAQGWHVGRPVSAEDFLATIGRARAA